MKVELLLDNFSYIIVPLFFYQMFCVDKGKIHIIKNRICLIFLAGGASILCMSNPLKISAGFILDFRNIPFILGCLYGDFWVGIPLFMIMMIYRFYIGGIGAYAALVLNVFLLLALLKLRVYYEKMTKVKKIFFTISVTVFITLTVSYVSQLLMGPPFYNISRASLIFLCSQSIAMWIITYMVEAMIYNYHLHKEIIHTEKLKVVSELSASISHEVRNPLTVTKGFLQMLSEPDLTFEKRKSYVDISLTELERAEMIINDYLAITKVQKESIIVSNLLEDINYITNVLKPYSIIHNVEVQKSFSNKYQLKYDRNQLRQCLINIAKNGIEAMPEGGLLKISIFSVKSKVKITISDTGVGMNEEEIQRLGTPYYTTKEKGTGLGMTVVYSAIQSMQGKISVESKKGVGTEFTITLPIYVE